MRSLGNILQILSREGPMTVAREAAWRFYKPWRAKYLMRELAEGDTGEGACATRPSRWRALSLGRTAKQTGQTVRVREVPYYRPQLTDIGSEQREIILRLADGVCAGRIPFVSYETQDCGLKPRWGRDFISGKEWPLEASGSLTVVGLDGSDIKAPWELSRLQFLPLLGKAYRLDPKPVYRETARRYVEHWMEANPVGRGANWVVAMEVALRGLNIAFLTSLLWPFAEEEKPWLDKVARGLRQHLLYIEAHLEFSHIVRGNHYLSNLLGLYGLAVFLDGPGMKRRRARYRALLEQEILLHVYADGGNYEASSGYHVLVAQMFLTAHQLMRAENVVPAESFTRRLGAMFTWMETLADSSGRLPHIGDCDDGRVEFLFDDLKQMDMPAARRDSLRVSSLLGLGRAALGRPAGYCDAELPWFGLRKPGLRGAGLPEPGLPKSGLKEPRTTEEDSGAGAEIKVLADSGIALARWGSSDLLFLAVPNGIQGKGTHTHNDKLSVILRMDGEEVLCDSGTGCYTRDRATRDRFRSTTAHNTVRVDGVEQNRIPRARMNFFSIGNEARVSRIEASSDGKTLKASHFGYEDRGMVHTRSARFSVPGEVLLEDHISGEGEHRLELCFHAGLGWEIGDIRAGDDGVTCELRGSRTVEFRLRAERRRRPVEIEMRAEKEEAGISWVYGTTVPAGMLRITATTTLPATFVTTFSWKP
ncbi:MAG TPA: alginate lyase family protein [Candidatus Angelobacter sp.]|nr:alginate lyase family protein [Candidatus Angelobacter sp.]